MARRYPRRSRLARKACQSLFRVVALGGRRRGTAQRGDGLPQGLGDGLLARLAGTAPRQLGGVQRRAEAHRDRRRLRQPAVARHGLEGALDQHRHDRPGVVGDQVADDLIGAESFECTVVHAAALTPLIREIVLQLPEGRRPDIFAGAFMQITAPPFALDYGAITVPEDHEREWESLRSLTVKSDEPVTRAYSVSNRMQDTEAGRLVFNIRLALPPPSVPEAQPGIVSSWLFSLEEGMMVEANGPFGTFRARESEREMVFIGGGVGMAPLRAMIHEQLEQLGSRRKMSFWYGARSKADLFYVDELDALAKEHDNFEWTVALSAPDSEDNWNGPTGFIHTIALERYLHDHPAPEACEYYLCGPPLMIRAVFAMLDDLGVDRDDILNDDFGV